MISHINKDTTSQVEDDVSPPEIGQERRQFPRHRKVKIGLALGAGVARGWAHIGVIRELAKHGISPDFIAGTSIGAVVGGALAADGLDALEEWATALKGRGFFRFLDLRLGGAGLFGSDKLDALMRERFGDKEFSELKIPFSAVACDLKTGHEKWLQEGDLSSAIRASFALPGLFEAQNIDGQWLVDGALVNPVPVSVCRAAGCEVVIAVNLSEDIYGRAQATHGADLDLEHDSAELFDMESFAEGSEPEKKSFFRRMFRDDKQQQTAPGVFNNMTTSLNIMQNRIARSRLAGDPPDVSIAPRCGHIGLMEFDRANDLIAEGRQATAASMPQLRDVLAVINMRINS